MRRNAATDWIPSGPSEGYPQVPHISRKSLMYTRLTGWTSTVFVVGNLGSIARRSEVAAGLCSCDPFGQIADCLHPFKDFYRNDDAKVLFQLHRDNDRL